MATYDERINADGWEVPDPQPLALPAGFKRPETLAEQVQRLVRTSMSRYAELHGAETFEEAEDFDVDDGETEPSTPYEAVFDPVLGRDITPQEMRRYEAVYRERYLKAQNEAFAAHDRAEQLKAQSYRKGEQPPPPSPPKASS